MAKPVLDRRPVIRADILDAVDERLRARCARGREPDAVLAIWVEERNRVARFLERPEFTAADLLVKGEDD